MHSSGLIGLWNRLRERNESVTQRRHSLATWQVTITCLIGQSPKSTKRALAMPDCANTRTSSSLTVSTSDSLLVLLRESEKKIVLSGKSSQSDQKWPVTVKIGINRISVSFVTAVIIRTAPLSTSGTGL